MANLWILAGLGTTLRASAVFSLFVTAPGYVAGWLTDACGFRKGSAMRKTALTVPLSISVLPILVYLPWRFLSIRTVWVTMAAVGVAFLIVLAMDLRSARFRWQRHPGEVRLPIRQRRAAWIVGVTAVAVWLLIARGWGRLGRP